MYHNITGNIRFAQHNFESRRILTPTSMLELVNSTMESVEQGEREDRVKMRGG